MISFKLRFSFSGMLQVWIGWILLGVFDDDGDWHDPVLAFGLLITATLILFIMYLPKVEHFNFCQRCTKSLKEKRQTPKSGFRMCHRMTFSTIENAKCICTAWATRSAFAFVVRHHDCVAQVLSLQCCGHTKPWIPILHHSVTS